MNIQAYEGNQPYIFLSYSHLDSDIVFCVIEQLQKREYRIWFDSGIEAGSLWAENIASHLETSKCMIAMVTNNYLASENCMDEIEHAKNTGIPTLIIYLEDVTLPKWFQMRHNRTQAVIRSQYATDNEFFGRIYQSHILDACREGGSSTFELVSSENKAEGVNFDDELENTFQKLFGKDSTQSDEELSPLQIIMRKKKEKKAANDFFKNIVGDDDKKPDVKEINTLNPKSEMENGKHFSIIDDRGAKTLIYQVDNCVDAVRNYSYPIGTPLKMESAELADGRIRRTYFIDGTRKEKTEIVILTIRDNGVLINHGFALLDEVRISKNPEFLDTSEIELNASKDESYKLPEGLYDISSAMNGGVLQPVHKEESKVSEAKMNATTVLIDIKTKEPVLRKVYFDEESREYKAFFEITPFNPYIAFQIRNQEGVYEPLSHLEMGRYIAEGSNGYAQDIMKAVWHFEQDGSGEALLEISHIFRDDPIFKDKDLALEYLVYAAQKDDPQSMTELAMEYLFYQNNIQDGMNLLHKAVELNYNAAKFFLAVLTELQIIDNHDSNDIISLYYESAADNYKPAQLRMSSVCKWKNWDKLVSEKDAEIYFYETKETGNPEFCLGGALMWEWGVTGYTELGILCLEKAFNKCNLNAAYDLFNYYLANDVDKCIEYAIFIIERIENTHFLLTFSRDLIGFENHSDELDKIVIKALEKVINIDGFNSSARYLLGWMFKNDRGIHGEYGKARELFEQAIKMGHKNAWFHLGDLYEKGLGVPASIEQALEYYEKGAEAGNKRCTERLEELRTKSCTIE